MPDAVALTEPGPADADRLIGAAEVFDRPPTREWSERFLTRALGFVTGVAMTHPDKGTEMFLYELGVVEAARGRGIGRALVERLTEIARRTGCSGMWVLTDTDNAPARRTYVSAGGSEEDPPVLAITWTLTGRSAD